MKNFKYRFTVFTPCYNSEKFIHRVFESLEKQIFRDFEWLVINDNSSDATSELIEGFISETAIQVHYINQEINKGVRANINRAIELAQGEYIVLFGHDDRMLKDALTTFDELLKKYPEAKSVYALAKNQNGDLVGKKYPKDEMISTYWEQFYDNENEEEKFQCWNLNELRKIGLIPLGDENKQLEAWLWGKFGAKNKSVFINKVLRIYYTNVSGQISANNSRNKDALSIYNYYVTWVNEFQYQIKNKKRRYRGVIAMVSYGLRINKPLFEMLLDVKSNLNKLICFLGYPVAFFYNLKYKD